MTASYPELLVPVPTANVRSVANHMRAAASSAPEGVTLSTIAMAAKATTERAQPVTSGLQRFALEPAIPPKSGPAIAAPHST
jgi:hypothetical protein